MPPKITDSEIASMLLEYFRELAQIKQNNDAFMASISKAKNITDYDRKLLGGMRIKLD